MGVLIFEGMKVGVLDGDFSVSVDEHGKMDSQLILSTSYNVLPLWLKIAYENIVLSKNASKDIEKNWCEDSEKQKELLLSELTPSIQVFVACGTALDALYEQLKPFSNISENDVEAWKRKKTSRSAQISEVIRRVYKLDNTMSKAFKQNIKSIMEYRDQAVHPTHKVKRSCTRPDIPVGVDWRFSAYRYSNSIICYSRTMEMFIHLYDKKANESAVNENMGNIFKALKELKLVSDAEKT